jgi:hypothetical protein
MSAKLGLITLNVKMGKLIDDIAENRFFAEISLLSFFLRGMLMGEKFRK